MHTQVSLSFISFKPTTTDAASGNKVPLQPLSTNVKLLPGVKIKLTRSDFLLVLV